MIFSVRNRFFRLVAQTILILLIGVKVAYPVVLSSKNITKEVSSVNENDDSESQKKGDTNTDPEKEVAMFGSAGVNHLFWYTYINHATAYDNHYCTAYYSEIAIPPPDIC